MRSLLGILILLIGASVSSYSSDLPPITISLSSNPLTQGQKVRFTLHILRHRDNQLWCVFWGQVAEESVSSDGKGFGYFRRSCQQLHGLTSPSTFWLEYVVTSAGWHLVGAQLIRYHEKGTYLSFDAPPQRFYVQDHLGGVP